MVATDGHGESHLSSQSTGRAEQRLEIASRLLRLPKGADVMKRINAMPPDEREELRGLVDWVEDYENYEQAMG